jgi:hypothetical protein
VTAIGLYLPGRVARSHAWASEPRALGRELASLTPVLRRRGIELMLERTARQRSWSIRRRPSP